MQDLRNMYLYVRFIIVLLCIEWVRLRRRQPPSRVVETVRTGIFDENTIHPEPHVCNKARVDDPRPSKPSGSSIFAVSDLPGLAR